MRKKNVLERYNQRRNFQTTPEPPGRLSEAESWVFVIQKHDAQQLHYDFRLELDGVLKSWAVPRGPSTVPTEKRLAVRTEDHPVDYGGFEGVIPSGYGAGTVLLWDRGVWRPEGDPRAGLEDGALKFVLDGTRLRGTFRLVRMRKKRNESRDNWLLIKEDDKYASPDLDIVEHWQTSVATGRDLDSIAKDDVNSNHQPSRETASRGEGGRTEFTPPQLATLSDYPPRGDDWLHEIKYDGYRLQALLAGGTVKLMSRNGKDWTSRFKPVVTALRELEEQGTVVDGEIVALDERGVSQFSLLQKSHREPAQLAYYAFDLLQHKGEFLFELPLIERKQRLRRLIGQAGEGILRYSDHIVGSEKKVLKRVCEMGLEGVISKRMSAPYTSGRSDSWLKSKCVGNDEFLVIGYRRSEKRDRPFSSLLLAEYIEGDLIYRGRVGTGFGKADMAEMKTRMRALTRQTSPLVETPAEAKSRVVWLSPDIIAQVAYSGLTARGWLRHPRFLGLREDKTVPEMATQDEEVDNSNSRGDAGTMNICNVQITHPDRIMFPQQGATKGKIARYYSNHAEKILPFLAQRPLSLVRCPQGRQKKCFFQRHHNDSLPEFIHAIDVREKSGERARYLYLDSVEGLVSTIQIGALELHPWSVRADRLERPERLVFDLDPDPSLPFARVRDAALELREVLESVGLESYALLTGGKGIHVIVPIIRRVDWDDVKYFTRGLAQQMAAAAPDRYIATASKAKRRGKVFIDWLRNERGGTAVAPYTIRAREGAPVATPIAWSELPRIENADAFTLDNIDQRMRALANDPWKGYLQPRQTLTRAQIESVE